MATLNPDFRGADDVIVPPDHLDRMGWTDGRTEERFAIAREARGLDRLEEDMPIAFGHSSSAPRVKLMDRKWVEFQKSKGRYEGSDDWTLLDEFAVGQPLLWKPQIIGSCFPAGTLIRKADGSHKPIEQIRVFDQVLTAEGNISHVSAVMGREVSEDIYSVALWGHPKVKMTAEHPVLTRRGYVKASELTLSDYVRMPAIVSETANVLITEEHYTLNRQMRRRIAKGDIYGERSVHGEGGVKAKVKVYRKVPDIIELTPDFGWLIGIALAEGGTDGNKVVFTFHAKEENTLARRVVDIFDRLFGIEASLTIQYKSGRSQPSGDRMPEPKTCKVSVHSVAWASLFDSLIGKQPQNKRIHADLLGGNAKFLRAMIEGWLDGDGYERNGVRQGTTVSKQLAHDMMSVGLALGERVRMGSVQPKVSHGVKSRKRRYDVHFGLATRLKPKGQATYSQFDDCGVWRKVRSITTQPFQGKVYNFEVYGDNSYVADGIGVHNCVVSNTLRPYVTRMMYQIIMLGMGQEYLGRSEFGPDNFSFYGPWTYGMARRRANMRSGDGLYFEPMAASLLKDGVLPCNTPALVSFLQSKGLADPTDFPEPQGSNGARLYREFGQHRYLDEFKQYATAPVEEINRIRNGDELWEALGEGKTAFCCSMEAIHKVGTHKDGFAIHARNRRDRWAHNMSFQGRMVASDGDRFIRHCNQSWGENHLYNRRLEELDWELRNGGLTCGTIGPIRSPISKAPSV